MCEKIIEIADVSYSYPGGRTVLEGTDLVVNRHDRIGIIGPNGCGKTTLFHLIMGLIPRQSGCITIFGKAVHKEEDFIGVRRRIGYVFQNSEDQLFCPTVMEDVAFGPINLGRTPAEAREIAVKTLNALGIPDFGNRISHKLSHGEKKLVAMASVLAMGPEVLILDEPTAGLDNETKKRLMDIINGLDLTLVLASHEVDFMSGAAQTFYAFAGGRMAKADHIVPHTHTHIHAGGDFSHLHEDKYT